VTLALPRRLSRAEQSFERGLQPLVQPQRFGEITLRLRLTAQPEKRHPSIEVSDGVARVQPYGGVVIGDCLHKFRRWRLPVCSRQRKSALREGFA
jgi:hypothetical protein